MGFLKFPRGFLKPHIFKTPNSNLPSGGESLVTLSEAVKKIFNGDLGKKAWDSDALVMYGMNKFDRINEMGKAASEFSLW